MTSRVVVVGLGPAGPELLTAATTAAIDSIPVRFLRTRRHAAAPAVIGGESFDDLVDSAAPAEDPSTVIVERLVEAATSNGEILYAVPGSPRLIEPTVELLQTDTRVETHLVPALSFLDLAWIALDVDPVAHGVQLVDASEFAAQAAVSAGPFLVTGVVGAEALGALADSGAAVPRDQGVVVLQGLGSDGESVQVVACGDLETAIRPDDRTTVFVPKLGTPDPAEFVRFGELVLRLRRECPWDREQTHESLRRHLLEETYEVLEAIDAVVADDSADAYAHLEEELGDLLYQVYFHAALAAEQGRFEVGDVVSGIDEKLRRRHPHVFGEVEADGSAEVLANWESIKRAEKQRESVLDGIPLVLPALLLESKLQAKSGVLPSADLASAAREALAADPTGAESAIGELLQVAVAVSREKGVDPELALHDAASALALRYRAAETAAAADGVDLGAADTSLRSRYL